jgi:multidrug resistance efflux pump
MSDIERLMAELEECRAQLARCEEARQELQARVDSLGARLDQERTARVRAEALYDATRERVASCENSLNDCRTGMDQAQAQLRSQEGELGRLRAIAETVESLRSQLANCQQELARVTADCERQVTAEVKAALDRAAQERDAAAQQWAQERQTLETQIEDLRRQLEERGVVGHMAPADLASRFASVLDQLAEGEPAPGRAFAVGLTGLEVEARGVLEAPREGEEQPRFVTVEAGGVDPSQLSTMRMTFRLLPRTPPTTPGQPEG